MRLMFVVTSLLGPWAILLSLLGTVSSLSLHYLNRKPAHRRLDKTGAICFPLVYALLLAALLR